MNSGLGKSPAFAAAAVVQEESSSWPAMRTRLIALAFVSGLVAGFCWLVGPVEPFVEFQIALLIILTIGLNFGPGLFELAAGRFDPCDAKHLFLAYFFLVLTAQSVISVWGGGGSPAFATPEEDSFLVVKSLSVILLGLCAFVAGCYLPLGRMIARVLPPLGEASRARIWLAAPVGCAAGLLAFWQLMRSAGGVGNFLANLGSWRTTGILEGVGYLTFPIAVVLPASTLLMLIHVIPRPPQKVSWTARGATLLSVASVAPLFVLGFRGMLVPALLQILVAWHYTRRRFSFARILIMGAALVAFLSVYGVARGVASGEDRSAGDWKRAMLARIAGFQMVERVVWRMEQGEPYRGARLGLVESAVILVPRSLWAGKPRPANLDFADIFFFDFFLARGDPLDGVRSGISPTVIGELLWIRGLPAVGGGCFLLGVFAAFLVAWRQHEGATRLRIFIYAIFMTWFPLFVEAPQNTLNTFSMLIALCLGWSAIVTFGIRRKAKRV